MPRRGNCYVTSEAIYHLAGGKTSGWVPMHLNTHGESHWFLRHKVTGVILDATAVQFGRNVRIDYSKGRGTGFLTKHPSKRAKVLMEQMVWQ